MKVSIVLLFSAIVLVGGFTYSEMQQSNLLTQQIDDYVRQNSQLLTQIENNSLKNSESAKTLRSLQDKLNLAFVNN
jgi:archaellum component FlaF (FlaF/FlaG flagellin family)